MIKKVTITGADDSIHHLDLINLSDAFPFVEWAILLSMSAQGTRTRFPTNGWMSQITSAHGRVAGHLCGSYVREFLIGNDIFVKTRLSDIWPKCTRIQINTHGVLHKFKRKELLDLLAKHSEKEFIFQYDEVNRPLVDMVIEAGCKNVSTLFDMSHGTGISPASWPKPVKGIRCGYAGGIGPDNIEEQIQLVNQAAKGHDTWIDMETKVRSEDDRLFDYAKVVAVLAKAKELI